MKSLARGRIDFIHSGRPRPPPTAIGRSPRVQIAISTTAEVSAYRGNDEGIARHSQPRAAPHTQSEMPGAADLSWRPKRLTSVCGARIENAVAGTERQVDDVISRDRKLRLLPFEGRRRCGTRNDSRGNKSGEHG
jgi:hypothetical protein